MKTWLEKTIEAMNKLNPDFKFMNETKKQDNRYKYECLNEAKSWSDGMKKNNFPKITFSEEKTLISEGIDFEPEENEKGGIIVFSTDVNAVEFSPNKIKNWLKQKIATISNRFQSTKKIDKIADKHQLIGWTIGHYLDGRYKAKNGKMFGENSLSVEIIGVDFDKLLHIAEDICKDFKQESVLLQDFSSGRVLFVNPE